MVIAKSRLQISLSWPNLYKFYLKITSLTEFYRKTKDMVLKALKESLMKPLALGHLNCQILFSFLCMKRKGILCMKRKGILTPKHRQTRGQPSTRIFKPETGLRVGTPLALETLRPQPFWLRTPGKYCEISFNHFLYLMQ